MNTNLHAVEQVLRASDESMRIGAIAVAARMTEDDVKLVMRQLAKAGQIELIPGGRNGNRYAWLGSPVSHSGPDAIEQVATITRMSIKSAPFIDEPDPAGVGLLHLVRVPKRKPRIVADARRAHAAALAAVRNGAPRADVFTLIPVGTASRGAEWKTT